eukprot:TRINITY_DN20070_c0_g1_i1.p3 TRINITY_DN20070_c0_g1~~TRINITY_DN20070_c0_g1_i1.p3  ORF type:complete len:149 (-),score=36.29 TRINITY_DN20070_c0_g1_i1:26-472(-)
MCLALAAVWEYEWPPFSYHNHAAWARSLDESVLVSLAVMIVAVSVLSILSNNLLLDIIGPVNTTSVWLLVPVVGMVSGIEWDNNWPPGFPLGYKLIQIGGCAISIASLGFMLLAKRGQICARRAVVVPDTINQGDDMERRLLLDAANA